MLPLLGSVASAQVSCWAPGMSGAVNLTENTRSLGVSLGTPYRYDVFGVAGQLTLGDRAANAQVVDGGFRQKLLGLLSTGTAVESTAGVGLQTGLTRIYPEYLSVKGGSPGDAVGPTVRYGENWTLCDPRHPAAVNLTFHLCGSSLLAGLAPGLLSPPYYNLNPSGSFHVLGECHLAPPVMTGNLSIAEASVLYGRSVVVGFHIDREEQTPVYRPPFLGLDLGDADLTVFGTPPGSSGGGATGFVDVPDLPAPDLLAVTIDLSGSQGDGWIKIRKAP
ncbi:hypothetical protein [Luteolibacter marinus]|uniref:hypothetical protein n=1 Tax=Luteolibacter marinus TaxID=2776705 RepID=UPI001868CFCD|nr:hypothetical protein [Luteolibacter marinus]